MTGVLSIVGLGPGGAEHRTPAAARAVSLARVLVGYGPYLDACTDLLHPDHEVVRAGMGEEGLRADEALARAAAGARVALVSGGDPGVYGMAARTLARAAALPADGRPEVLVVPGVTAATAAAALLGAPLADDFAVLSLSDLHQDWARIERRIAGVAAAGLALALYNPRSRARTWQLDRVLELLREHRGADVPVGVVTDAGRDGEHVARATLATLDPTVVGMRSLLLVAGDTAVQAGPWLLAERARSDEPRDPRAEPDRPTPAVGVPGDAEVRA